MRSVIQAAGQIDFHGLTVPMRGGFRASGHLAHWRDNIHIHALTGKCLH